MVSLRCLFGKHQRSGRHARKTPSGHFESVCKHCGKPMWRAAEGEWALVGEHDESPEAKAGG